MTRAGRTQWWKREKVDTDGSEKCERVTRTMSQCMGMDLPTHDVNTNCRCAAGAYQTRCEAMDRPEINGGFRRYHRQTLMSP